MTDEDEATGYEIVTVRENSLGEHDTAISRESEKPSIRGPEDYGAGTDLEAPAHDEIRETLDLEEYEVGEHVATIWLDYDAWTYEIEYHVGGVLERVRRILP